jgi:hypothetical protein
VKDAPPPDWLEPLDIDGLRLSRLAFGTSKLFRLHSSRERQRLLHTALDLGITHFDTARSYGLGAAEAELGRFLTAAKHSGRLSPITVATKFGIPTSRAARWLRPFQSVLRRVIAAVPRAKATVVSRGSVAVGPRNYSVAEAEASLAASLAALRLDQVDALFLHDPPAECIFDPTLHDWFAQKQSEGLIRTWGVSGSLSAVLAIRENDSPLVRVCQYGSDAVERLQDSRIPPRPRISFRPMAEPLPVIEQTLSRHPAALSAWRSSVDYPTDSMSIATLLLIDSLAAPHDSCVVFATTRPDRLESFVQASRRGPDAYPLAAFREWLRRFVVASNV